MPKYNFIDETDKLARNAVNHELTRSKIDETLMNIKAPKGGVEEMALEEIALRGAAVGRALQLDREPHLLRAGYEHPDPQPWHEWDPVMVHIMKPDKTITVLAHAQQVLEESKIGMTSIQARAEIDFEISVLQRMADCIEEQI